MTFWLLCFAGILGALYLGLRLADWLSESRYDEIKKWFKE